MTNAEDAAKAEAIENVKRVALSHLAGADPGTVMETLRNGFDKAGVRVSEEDIARIADEIHQEKDAQVGE